MSSKILTPTFQTLASEFPNSFHQKVMTIFWKLQMILSFWIKRVRKFWHPVSNVGVRVSQLVLFKKLWSFFENLKRFLYFWIRRVWKLASEFQLSNLGVRISQLVFIKKLRPLFIFKNQFFCNLTDIAFKLLSQTVFKWKNVSKTALPSHLSSK